MSKNYRYNKSTPRAWKFILGSWPFQAGTRRFVYMSVKPPAVTFEAWGNLVRLTTIAGREEEFTSDDPIGELKKCLLRFGRSASHLPGNGSKSAPFRCGAAGYFSYECGWYYERLPAPKPDTLGVPDIAFGIYDEIAVVGSEKASEEVLIADSELVSLPEPRGTLMVPPFGHKAEWFPLRRGMKPTHCQQSKPHQAVFSPIDVRTNRKEFEAMVRRAKKYIAEGDVYQVNLSHRMCLPFAGSPEELYYELCRINPSPYACLLQFDDFSVVSCSPELLLSVSENSVETRPIAGTRPRGRTPYTDKELRAELLLNPKERAEHIMLVDLERNDLGRVCRYGSVKVAENMVLESYSHVSHIVSDVKGRLVSGEDGFDALRAVFPGGTISGCPKIRCMKIIRNLEPAKRGPFFGSAGWIDFNGNMELNLLIRTVVVKDGKAYVQVGSGIVADSAPEKEYQESIYKAQAMLQAIRQTLDIRL